MKFTFWVLLLSTFLLIFTGCKNTDETVQTESPTEEVTTTQTTSTITATTTLPTTVATTVTTTATTTETTTGYTEREILESICIEMYGEVPPFSENKDHVEYLIETAKTLPDKYSHSVADKDDLTEQARNIWIETLGSKYIEYIESEYVELQGELVKYERDNEQYTIKYYEEYDVWYINPNAPSGVTEKGTIVFAPSMPPYLLIRGEDGKILGALI